MSCMVGRASLLKVEEEYIERLCNAIIKLKPDVVITEKGLSDLAAHYLTKAGISGIRRVRKTDNNRIARACGATIVYRPEEAKESDLGTKCGLFEVVKIGDEFFTFIVDCDAPKACTVLLRWVECQSTDSCFWRQLTQVAPGASRRPSSKDG